MVIRTFRVRCHFGQRRLESRADRRPIEDRKRRIVVEPKVKKEEDEVEEEEEEEKEGEKGPAC